MTVSKQVAINLGGYESLRLSAEGETFEVCDRQLIDEVNRLGIPISKRIKQSLGVKQ